MGWDVYPPGVPYVDEEPKDADPLMVVSTTSGPWQNRHPGAVLSDLQQARRSLGAAESDPGALLVASDELFEQLAEDGYRIHKLDGRIVVYGPGET